MSLLPIARLMHFVVTLSHVRIFILHAELQAFLSDTDYAVIKCGELKLDLETEYLGLSEKRAQARAKINELESEFAELRATKTDYPIIV